MRRVLTDPLFHFVLAGVAIFALVGDEPGVSREALTLTPARADTLFEQFERRMGRPPGPDEQRILVRTELEDEALFREALMLGLEQSDVIVRRRLVQKMRFFLDDLSPVTAPTEGELLEALAADPVRYRALARFEFRHVVVEDERAGAAVRHSLEEGADPASVGRPSTLGSFVEGDAREIASHFSRRFVDALEPAELGRWIGPIRSTHGWDLVWLVSRTPRRDGSLADPGVRARVGGDVRQTKRRAAVGRALSALVEQHGVSAPSLALGSTP